MRYCGVLPGDIVAVNRETWIDGPSWKRVNHWVKVKRFYIAAEIPSNNGAFHARDGHGKQITLDERDCLQVYRRHGDRRELVFSRQEKPIKADSDIANYVASVQRRNMGNWGNDEAITYWEGRCLDMGERVD